MSALENAKNMSVEEILAKTAASGLLEFGVERSVVTEKWNQVNAEREFQTNPIRVVAFIVKKRAQKTARNISKNTTIIIPEHNIPAFKPAKTFTLSVKK